MASSTAILSHLSNTKQPPSPQKSTPKNGSGYYTGLPHPPLQRTTNNPSFPPKPKRNQPGAIFGGAPAGLILGNTGSSFAQPISFSEFLKLKQSVEESKSANASQLLCPDYQRHADLQKEKLRLHEDSIAMVEKWNNTIAGQRKIKLQALNEKTRIAEEARVEMDRDWAQVKAAERQSMIDRAKRIQYQEEARVRQLNSQALVTQVLKERKMQIERKNVDKSIEDERTHEQLQAELDRLKAADNEAMEMQRRVKQIMLETANTNKQMSQARQMEQQREREELRVWFETANARAAQELLDIEHERCAKKSSDTKELVDVLNWAVADKQVREEQGAVDESELDRINAEINLIKESIARKRKETEIAMIRSRISRNEYVASLQVPIQDAYDKDRTAFLEKLESANQGNLEYRLYLESEKRKIETHKCLQAMNKNIADREHQRMLDSLEAAQIRKQNELAARAAVHSASVRREAQAHTRKSFGDTYRKEMALHAAKAMVQKQVLKKEYVQSIDLELQKDLEFHDYANKLIDELKSIHNDPTLVVKKLDEIDLDIRARARYNNSGADSPIGGGSRRA